MKGHRELSGYARFFRKIAMTAAPDTRSSTNNDIFNKGYGELVASITQICFFVTFFYYVIINIQTNVNARFLSPFGQQENTGDCIVVPLQITETFTADSFGNWNGEKDFVHGESFYRLQMSNSQYESGALTYKSYLNLFSDNLKNQSIESQTGDYAWNLAFAGSYSDVKFDDYHGRTDFFIDADSRIMYDQAVYVGGYGNADGACVPDNSYFYFENGHFKVSFTNIYDVYTFDPCPGLLNPYNDLGYYSGALIDAASSIIFFLKALIARHEILFCIFADSMVLFLCI
jgi:hypothetical protein